MIKVLYKTTKEFNNFKHSNFTNTSLQINFNTLIVQKFPTSINSPK